MSDSKPVTRRNFLFISTAAFSAAGAVSIGIPLVSQMNPDASVKALASTEVNVSTIIPGQSITVLWRGKPVFIRRRTETEIIEAQKVKMEDLPDPEGDEKRVQNPEWLVMVGI